MDNYVYIVASLPNLSMQWTYPENQDMNTIIDFINENSSDKDKAVIQMLLDGFCGEKLNKEFYEKAFVCKNKFIREFFKVDLALKNAKVKFLNKELGKSNMSEGIFWELKDSKDEEFASREIFSEKDLLKREKKVDDYLWNKAEELSLFHDFDLDKILSIIVKLEIIDRWLRLDKNEGKEKFKSLVKEVRESFSGVPQI